MRFLINNWFSLLCYVVIDICVYFLTALSLQPFGYRLTSWELVFLIPILIATPFLFILVGRYALKTQGSSIKDLSSVILVCIIGLLLTPSIAYFKHSNGNLNLTSLYFSYVEPLDVTIQTFKSNWDVFMLGKGLPGIISGGICSFIPTLLMWIGLRWQSRKHPSL
jgi:hypothetical protein